MPSSMRLPILFRWLLGMLAVLLVTLLLSPLTPAFAAPIMVNTTDGGSTADGLCSLAEAITAANTDAAVDGCAAGFGLDTITLGTDVTLTADLPQIRTQITLEGGGHSVSGSNTRRVFYVTNPGDFRLNQVTVQNGSSDNGGGLYSFVATVTITNSTFSGSTATQGGGIYVYYGTVTISNSIFSSNDAGLGGGLYNHYGTLTLSSSTLSGNWANDSGGGLYNNRGTANLSSSTFSGNWSTNNGGGLYNNRGTAAITASTFSGNSAYYGGGLYTYSTGTLTLSSSTLSGNSANSGGGLYTNGGTATVTTSTFSGNTADTSGGSFYTGSGTIYLAGTLLDTGASGTNCGGGVTDNGYNLSDDGSCGFSATGSANNATLNLGTLQNNGGSTLTHQPALNSNAVKRIPNGTTINNNGVTLDCNGTTIDQIGANRPIKVGEACTSGAIEVLDCSSVTTEGELRVCIDAANITPGTVDTITLGANITLAADLPQISSTIRLEGDGYFVSGNNRWRMFYVTSTGNFTLNQVTVQNGRSLGGLYNDGGTVTITSSTVSGNSGYYGGGLYNNGGTVTITSSTVSDNSASIGGGLATSNGTVAISNSTVSGNSATELFEGGGGGIYNSNSSTVTISNSTVSGNSGYYGGGIYNSSGTVTISNSTVSGNSAGPSWGAGRGGGLDNRGTMTITNTTVSGNSAIFGGGLNNVGTMTITNTTISGNSATFGGGIYRTGGTIYLAGVLLNTGASGVNCVRGVTDNGYNLSDDSSCGFSAIGSANNATLNLGTLQNNGGSTLTHKPGSGSDVIARIPNGTTVNNNGVTLVCNSTTTDQTGAARPLASGVPCTSGAVEALDCSSVTHGGVLGFCINLANASPATPDTITLAANITLTANLPMVSSPITLEGGGYSVSGSNTRPVFFVISTGNLTLNQVTVQDGRAYAYGGGLLNFEGTVTITNSTFSNNQASGADVIGGGGLYNSGTVTITNSTFSGNSAGPNGAAGGGLLNVGTAIISNSTFSGNTADFGGGLINYEGATMTIISSTFSGNIAYSGGGLLDLGGITTITSSTVSGNSATYGGGLLNDGGTIYLAGMLLDTGASSSSCYGTPVTDNGYNLSDDGSCGFSATGSSNSATLNLESLADNGGSTLTHKPALDSDAIARIPNGTTVNNNGVTLVCNSTTTDQTGASRPMNAGEACTSGAVEVILACPSAVTTEGELRGCINLANASPATHDTITLGENITLTADLPAVGSPITLEGGGYFVSGNNSRRVFSVTGTGIGSFTLNNVSVQDGNAGTDNGGGLSITGGTVNISNSTFSSNAAENGGGLYNQDGTLTVTNSTFSANSASGDGGGIYNGGMVTLNNSILANSASGVDCSSTGGTVNAQHSLIEDGLDCINGTNTDNLTGDPALNDDLTLTEFSPAVNTGDNDLIPGGITTDLAGNARIIGGIVDMGAYESPYITTVTIEATDGSAAETGGVDNGTFRISRGTETEGALTVSFTKGGTTTDGSDYTLGTSAVIPDGQTFVDVTLTAADDGSSAEPDETVILTLTDTAAYNLGRPSSATVTITRNGVTSTNANDSGEGSLRQAVDNANTFGGGTVTFSGVSAITLGSPIEIFGNVTIDGANTLTLSASGFRAFSIMSGTVVLKGFTISGGGVDVSGGNVTIGNDPVFIIGNNTTVCGGGLLVNGGAVTLQAGSQITGNTTSDNGGGICVTAGSLTVTGGGTQVNGNTATLDGGGIYVSGGTVTVESDASVNGNTATNGGGIYQAGGDLSVTGSRVEQNTSTASSGSAISFAASGTRSVTNTCIVGNNDTAVTFAGGSGVIATGNWWGSAFGPFTGLDTPAPNDTNTLVSTGDQAQQSTDPSIFDYSGYITTPVPNCFACTAPSGVATDRASRVCSVLTPP